MRGASRQAASRESEAAPVAFDAATAGAIAKRLLAWYDEHRRDPPWRAPPGTPADPYRVWVSEIMLQQTTVATVTPYFLRFMARWPTVEALAAAELDDVLRLWQGLGYYARARNLHACARALIAEHGGRWPGSEAELRRLPGIGAYTAAAIAAIAHGRRTLPVDGNVTRVLARLLALTTPPSGARALLATAARALAPGERPGDFAQAMMDLGATVCVPRRPRCEACPVRPACQARARGLAADLPLATPKPERPTRYGLVYWLARGDGAVLLRRRPAEGLLGGLMTLPTSDWRGHPWVPGEDASAPPSRGWRPLAGAVRHVFSHFALELTVLVGEADPTASPAGQWARAEELAELALPTLMRKVIARARDDRAEAEAGSAAVAPAPSRRRRRGR